MKRIGIDLGGTTVKGALFTDGEIGAEVSLPTPSKSGGVALLEALFTAVEALGLDGVEQIGLSSAGNIHPEEGVCVYATDNLRGWTGMPIKREMEARFRIPCKVENDAVCALLGELRFYPEARNVTMLTFGTGVGGASLVNGTVLRGRAFDAGRWGHLCLVPGGRKCSCGRRGCAEAYLSATALYRNGKRKVPVLASCAELFERFARGEGAAEAVLSDFGRRLNELLLAIRTVLSPELILLGGGVMGSQDIVTQLLDEKEDVRFARLGSRAGVYGAAGL